MSRIVNRRNAVIGWAMWRLWRRRARRKAANVIGDGPPPWRRWPRRAGALLAAVLAAVGLVAAWRKLRGGTEEEWTAPEPLDAEPAEPTPLSSVEPDDDIPPAA